MKALQEARFYLERGKGRTRRLGKASLVKHVRKHDDKLHGGDVQKPQEETRVKILLTAALREMAGIKFADIDRFIGWPESTARQMKNTFPQTYREMVNACCDRALDEVIAGKLRMASRLLAAAENATEVLICAMNGLEYVAPGMQAGSVPSKDQRMSAESVIRLIRDFPVERDGEVGEDEVEIDEESKKFEVTVGESAIDEKIAALTKGKEGTT